MLPTSPNTSNERGSDETSLILNLTEASLLSLLAHSPVQCAAAAELGPWPPWSWPGRGPFFRLDAA